MKTAISIPSELFERGERLARRLGTSRSQLYSRALAEFVARHSADTVTQTMDEVCEELGVGIDDFVRTAAQRALERSEW
jgi:predicted transcriptional regulator